MFVGLWMGYRTWQFVAWLLSLSLLVAAFWTARWGDPSDAEVSREPWTATELTMLAAIIVLGAFFRLYRLNILPPGLWIDECNVTYRAVQLMKDKAFLPFGCLPLTWQEEWVQTSNLYLYSIIFIFKIFGYNYYSIKMISVLPGIVGVPALYLFCRELAGKRAAMCAGFFFAVGHWNVRLSRWGWDEVAMTTLQVISFYFLVRGFRGRQRRDFIWAGIWMGLCLYTYIASRLAFAAALVCLGLFALSRWRGWRMRMVPLFDFVLATVLTVAPLSVFYLQHPKLFNVRTAQVNIFTKVREAGSLRPLWDNVERYLLMFHVRGDIFLKHDLPYAPLLDPIVGVLFVLGLAVAFWKWRSPGYLLCVCWLTIGLLAGILSENFDFPHAYRTGNVAPVAAALAALPFGWLLSRAGAGKKYPRTMRAVSVALVIPVIGGVVWLNYQNYFVTYAHLKPLWDDMMVARGTNVARHVLEENRRGTVYFSRWALDAGFSTVIPPELSVTQTLIKQWNPDYWDPDTDPPLRDLTADAHYFCRPEWKRWLSGWYPHMGWNELRNMYGDVYCAVADIPIRDIEATRGLDRHVIGGTAGQPPVDPHALQRIGPLEGTWTLFEGYIYQRLPGFATFGVPDADVAGIWFDEQRILQQGEQVSAEPSVQPGLHSVWLLLPGEHEQPPHLMYRNRWLRDAQVPLDHLAPALDSAQPGLRATFFAGRDWQGAPVRTIEAAKPTVVPDHPAVPYSDTWDGYLRVDRTADYILGAAMDDGGSVSIDGQRIFDNPGGYAEGTIALTVGQHRIEIRHYETGGGSYLSLFWVPPGEKEVIADAQWAQHQFAPLDAAAFYRLPFAGRGLRARYYDNEHFDGAPFLSVLEAERWLSHHQGDHFSVEFEGDLYVPSAGVYTLGLNSDDGSWLYLDGQLVVDNGGIHGFAPVSRTITLSQGRHHILVRYFQDSGGSGLQILWAPEGEALSEISPVFLYPAG